MLDKLKTNRFGVSIKRTLEDDITMGLRELKAIPPSYHVVLSDTGYNPTDRHISCAGSFHVFHSPNSDTGKVGYFAATLPYGAPLRKIFGGVNYFLVVKFMDKKYELGGVKDGKRL